MYIHLFNFYVGCRLIYSTLFIENDSKKQQKQQQQQQQQTDRQTAMTITIERAQSATVADKAKSS